MVVTVEVQPLGALLQVESDETLFQAAQRDGYYWPTVCGGSAECKVCRCEIIEGRENALPMEEREASALASLGQALHEGDRLACCLKVRGPVVVRKERVRKR